MLRHVDPPTVVRRVVVDRIERPASGTPLSDGRSGAGHGARRPGRAGSKGLWRAEAAQARKAEAREGPQPREGGLAAWGLDQPAGQPGGMT